MNPARIHTIIEIESYHILFLCIGKMYAVILQYIRLSKYHKVHVGVSNSLNVCGNVLVYIQRNKVKMTRDSNILSVELFSLSIVAGLVKYPEMKINRGM